jgi:hypothetical protein
MRTEAHLAEEGIPVPDRHSKVLKVSALNCSVLDSSSGTRTESYLQSSSAIISNLSKSPSQTEMQHDADVICEGSRISTVELLFRTFY